MGVEIHLDIQAIKKIEQAAVEAAEETLKEVENQVDNTIPFNIGTLRDSMYVDKREIGDETHVFLDNSCIYARYLYFGNKMVDEETGKGPALIHDKDGGEIGLRFKKDAKLKVKQPIEKLNFRGGRTDHWFDPYISGDKKDFVQNTYTELFKEKSGV